jgi:hypothetical protein
MSPTAPIEARQRVARDATRDRHAHPPNFWGVGFLGGVPTSSGWTDRHDALRLEGFGFNLSKEDEVVVQVTGNAMAVVRALSRHVARALVANALQVKAIGHAHVKTCSGLPAEVWLLDARAQAPASGSPQPSRPASHPDQEAFPSSGASYPAVPTCRLVRPAITSRTSTGRRSAPRMKSTSHFCRIYYFGGAPATATIL